MSRTERLQVCSTSAADTLSVARRVGSLLRPGDLVLLVGELGAGKTVFAKGVALALGVREPVVSPTFTIMCEYPSEPRFVHIDVYRLTALQELHDLGFDDVLGTDAVAVLEWGDRVRAALPGDRLEVEIVPGVGDDERLLLFEARGGTWSARRDALAATVLGDDPFDVDDAEFGDIG
jgi:tRNA threonylcarbamoyladenosine biosynthesis protein TsaE